MKVCEAVINWLASLVECMRQKAYSALPKAAKEGEVLFETFIGNIGAINLRTGTP